MNFLISYRIRRKKGTLDKSIKIFDVLDETHGKRLFKKHMSGKRYKILNMIER